MPHPGQGPPCSHPAREALTLMFSPVHISPTSFVFISFLKPLFAPSFVPPPVLCPVVFLQQMGYCCSLAAPLLSAPGVER